MAKISMKKTAVTQKSKVTKSRMFKVILNGVEQKGVFTAQDVGMKTGILLDMMGGCTCEFIEVEEDMGKSADIFKNIAKGDDEEEENPEVSEDIKQEDAEESDAEESEESDAEESEEDSDVDVEVEVDKGCKDKTIKSILSKRGFIKKTDDDGIDSEELEEKANVESDVKVPDTPEPTEDVQEVETGVPDDVPEEESEDNDEAGGQEGNELSPLLEDIVNNNNVADMEIDALIGKAQKRNEAKTGIETIPFVGADQPYANNYRTTQMGEGKMDVMSQFRREAMSTMKSIESARAEMGGRTKGCQSTKRTLGRF